jgi:hypothetical protein
VTKLLMCLAALEDRRQTPSTMQGLGQMLLEIVSRQRVVRRCLFRVGVVLGLGQAMGVMVRPEEGEQFVQFLLWKEHEVACAWMRLPRQVCPQVFRGKGSR